MAQLLKLLLYNVWEIFRAYVIKKEQVFSLIILICKEKFGGGIKSGGENC